MTDLTVGKKITALVVVTKTLENMKLKETVEAPNFQRESIYGTTRRIKDRSSKRFSFHRVNDYYFTITRTR